MQGTFRRAGAEQLPLRIALEPVLSSLNSLALLHVAGLHATLAPWVRFVAGDLLAAQLDLNRVLFDELGPALLVDEPQPDFPAYLDALATEHPERLRARVLEARAADATAPALSEAAQRLLDAPFGLHDTAVGHLRSLWDGYLESEWSHWLWRRRQIAALLGVSPTGAGTPSVALAQNLQLLIAGGVQTEPGVQELVFVPSPHVGRHVRELRVGGAHYLFFDADLHLRTLTRDTPIKAQELLGRLRALTDPARLQVLTLLAQHDELALQELMALLDTSQPNVSRYLNALSPFLIEQRGKDGRKRYRLVSSQLDLSFAALKQSIIASPAAAERAEEELMEQSTTQRYLDAQGSVLFWPRSHDQRIALLTYLADRFTPEQHYTEKEVTAVLQKYVQASVRDHVTVRRDLLDYGLMQRSSDGARYWRAIDAAPQAPRRLTDEEAYAKYWGGETDETESEEPGT